MLRWRHIQADNIFELRDESRFARRLEGFDDAQFKPLGFSHLEYRSIRDAKPGSPFACAPAGQTLRRPLRRRAYNLGGINCRLAVTLRQTEKNRCHASGHNANPPGIGLLSIDLQSPGNVVIVNSVSRQHTIRARRTLRASGVCGLTHCASSIPCSSVGCDRNRPFHHLPIFRVGRFRRPLLRQRCHRTGS